MDEEEYDEEELTLLQQLELEPRKLNALDLFIAFWALLGSIMQVVTMFFDHVCKLLVAHRGYVEERHDFAEAIRADLESIPTKE